MRPKADSVNIPLIEIKIKNNLIVSVDILTCNFLQFITLLILFISNHFSSLYETSCFREIVRTEWSFEFFNKIKFWKSSKSEHLFLSVLWSEIIF